MMTAEKRTDVHRPSSADFDPEAYQCYGVFDMNPDFPMPEMTQHRMALINSLIDRGYRFGHGGSTMCGHCGANIRYAALMVREDVKQFIYVGETCLDNRFEMTKGEFQTLRKNAALNRERIAKRTQIEAIVAEHPVLAWASYAHNIAYAGAETVWFAGDYETEYATHEEALANVPPAAWVGDGTWQGTKRGTTWSEKTRTGKQTSTLADIWEKVVRYGNPSDKQVAFVVSLVNRLTEAEERLQARTAAAEAAKSAGVEVPTGKVVVEGVIVSTKQVSNDYSPYGGTVTKMVVQTDEGWKVYGTRPSSLYDADKGDRVRFTATLEQSRDDSLFGFFKRPSKASKV